MNPLNLWEYTSDENLTWNHHIKAAKNKACSR